MTPCRSSVLVVDNFAWVKHPPKMVLHNDPVVQDVPVRRGARMGPHHGIIVFAFSYEFLDHPRGPGATSDF